MLRVQKNLKPLMMQRYVHRPVRRGGDLILMKAAVVRDGPIEGLEELRVLKGGY